MGFVRETGKYMALSLVALCHAVFLLSFAFKIEVRILRMINTLEIFGHLMTLYEIEAPVVVGIGCTKECYKSD